MCSMRHDVSQFGAYRDMSSPRIGLCKPILLEFLFYLFVLRRVSRVQCLAPSEGTLGLL